MGVHGLATYLRENRVLSTPLILSCDQSKTKPIVPLVVDGWSCVLPIGTSRNIVENDSAALYTNFITSPVYHGFMVANLGSSMTL